MNKLTTITTVALLTLFLAGCQSNETVTSEQPQSKQTTQTTQAPKVEVTQTETQTQTQAQKKEEIALTQEKTEEVKKEAKIMPPKTKDKTAGSSLKGITIKSDGFAPSSITVTPGTKVIFINVDDALHWPASGVHPTHEICPGFDSLKGLAKNETYAFTFKEKKTCPFHDHLNPALHGSIIVQ